MPAHPPPFRALLGLAWPIVLARSTQAVVGFTDALMVAPLGQDALAAVTTGSMNSYCIIFLPIGVVFIVQSFAAQLYGRGELTIARRYGYYGLIFSAGAGLLALPLILVMPWLLGLLHLQPAVAAHMNDYMAIRLLSIGAAVGVEAIANWYGGLGNTQVALRAGVLTMVVNIVLNYLLIEGHLGAPAWGVAGAALASTLSAYAALIYVVVRFWRDRTGKPSGSLGLSWRELVRMLRFGVPNGINLFIDFAAFVLFIDVMVAHLGTVPLAALMVVMNINAVSFMPGFGLASAGAILAGQAIGEGRRDDVPRLLAMTAGVAVLWQCSVGLLYFVAPRAVVGWFSDPKDLTGELVAVGATMLVWSAGSQLFDATANAVSETLRSAGDTLFCMWARVILAWVLFLPASYVVVIVRGGGPISAILCLIGYSAVLAIVLLLRFRRGAWRKIDLTGVQQSLVE
ncbi:MAG TPA: MATE family efflux transporter [Myxococcaceae bacterium]|nr:MATE family efflux transporter [Myxococcaceae bacterium]